MSDSDEDNIRYGTPLEPYEEDEVPTKRKYQEPTDQYAVDAHGRRRFHGAFTGGFSAGFGNTVGSQEGWTPKHFKSSRQEKASVSSQRPEDFMDEEDRSEFGIAPKQMQTTSDFSGQKRPKPRGFHDGPIPGEPVLEALLRPTRETCAVRMLRAMGWREGQGAGERGTRADKRRAAERRKVYSCHLPPDMRPKDDEAHSENDSSDSEIDYDTLFAPDDYEPYLLVHKSDRFGLGYEGLSRHSVLGNLTGEYGSGDNTSRLVMKDKGKKVSIRGQAFGVGAFEADDEDIYAREDMSHYDFTLGPVPDKRAPESAKERSSVLEGFTLSAAGLPPVPAYPLPALPRDYVPLPAGARRSRFEPTTAPQRNQGLGRHELSPEARGKLLGEVPLPTTGTDTATSKQDDLLTKIMGRNLDFVSNSKTSEESRTDTLTETSIKATDTKTQTSINIIDMTAKNEENPADFISIKDSGKKLTKVFKPFATNPKKQARYEKYCQSGVLEQDGDIDRLNEWEREREIVEFEQAAKLYKPLTGIMGDRFTHASQPDDAVNPLAAVAKSGANRGAATPEQIEAAARGVYGLMTRSRGGWRPDALVCKRFNVPEPHVTRSEPKKDDRPKVSYSVFSYMESSVHDKNSFTKEQGTFCGSKSHAVPKNKQQATDQKEMNVDRNKHHDQDQQKIAQKSENTVQSTVPIEKISEQNNPAKRMTVAELFMKESESNKEQGKEVTETINQFDKMDLYKSIFLSDSEEEEETIVRPVENSDLVEFVDVPKNIVRNTSPPRGIFANIDFDELNSWRRTQPNKQTDKPVETKAQPEMDVETYGPRIPDNLKLRLEASDSQKELNKAKTDVQVIGSSSSSDDSWVDVKKVKAKKLKKKKHKSKDKKKKFKHRRKDR